MKYEVNIAELADHFVIVMKDKESGKVKKAFTLNHLGTDILRAFMEDTPQDELAPLLAERYDSSLEGMQKEISRFYKELTAY